MLPMKLNLTEELAATLRQLRLDHPINGEVLTAENLSKAIGNNRAWMSQIESRRLKKIKREDVIKIYRLLYNESDDYQAEYHAEVDLMKFISENGSSHKIVMTDGSANEKYSNHEKYGNNNEGLNYTNEDLLRDKKNLVEITSNIVDTFMNELKTIPSCIEHNDCINQFMSIEDSLKERFRDTLYVIYNLQLSALKYATEEEHKEFIESIDTISQKLNTIANKKQLEKFISELQSAKEILSDYDKFRNEFPEDKLLINVTLLLVGLSQHISTHNLLSLPDKIQYTNDVIFIIYRCSIIIKSKHLFNIKELSPDSNDADILNKINELQIYLSNIKENPVIIQGQISKYFTT